MTTEEFGSAYQNGYDRTTRLLVKRGLSWDGALETAQAAWARGWEKRGQLRNPNIVVNWINSIALNMHRSSLRHEPFLQDLPDLPAPPEPHLAAIDVQFILQTCDKRDRLVLQRHYLDECKAQDIAREQGLTETAVRLRLFRARRAVARTLAATSRDSRCQYPQNPRFPEWKSEPC